MASERTCRDRGRRAGHRAALAVVVGALLGGSLARADAGKAWRVLKGRIIASSEAFPAYESEDEMVAGLKKAAQKSLSKRGTDGGWPLHFMAFLRRPPGSSSLSLVFFEVKGKAKPEYTNVFDIGVQPTQRMVSSEVSLATTQGFQPGRSYLVRLLQQHEGRDVVFAETTLALK